MNMERNYSLAMLALALRIYGHQRQGDQLMRCAADPLFTDLVLGADQVARLLSMCGLECMGICMQPGNVTKALQDFANDRQMVLVGMQPSDLLPYKHWSVLEASWNDGVHLVVFGDDDNPITSDRSMAEITTGEFVVIAQQLDKCGIGNLRQAMGG